MMERITIKLTPDEHEALWTLAHRERRDFRDQAAMIIRADLEKRGLLPADPAPAALPHSTPAREVSHAQPA